MEINTSPSVRLSKSFNNCEYLKYKSLQESELVGKKTETYLQDNLYSHNC